MTTRRTFKGLSWIAKSPSWYILMGYPGIQAKYDGYWWKIIGQEKYPVYSMDDISMCVTGAVDHIIASQNQENSK